MEMLKKALILTLFALIVGFSDVSLASMAKKAENKESTYIVHVDKSKMHASFEHYSLWYESFLASVSDSAKMLYIYDNIHGFSARLTATEARLLESQTGILAVSPEQIYQIRTTRTPQFLGLDKIPGLIPAVPNAGPDIIIGLLDTGIWPESKSFDDTGLGPIPSSWKGQCVTAPNFTAANCNKKLIGARFYSLGFESTMGPLDDAEETKSPRDYDGHGTHTASTAAGSPVEGASLFGYASGTARGMAPHARVASYKVCWTRGCATSDILAAIDTAISDSVNILSLSLGGLTLDYDSDNLAIGAFAAMERGILVSCSAGNDGPTLGSVTNVAPWVTTVGASTIDRDFPAYLNLGNGKKYHGVSLYKGNPLPDTPFPFIYAGKASGGDGGCARGSLAPEKVKGKIVLCDRGGFGRAEKGYEVKSAGGLGMVLANGIDDGEDTEADAHLLPATAIGFEDGDAVKNFLKSDPNLTATIAFQGTKLGVQPAPIIASFSSRGPNSIAREILKPDLVAPGVNILAAYSKAAAPTDVAADERHVDFNIISGTSMACPHVSGIAALIKSAHPDWSPAVIRSALMTTAYATYTNGQKLLDSASEKPSTPLAHGAGHVDPVAALDPGLVYDLTVDDYLGFLCALNYTADRIKAVTRRQFKCDERKQYSVRDFNYPSFAVDFSSARVVKHTRTLTNLGPAGTYKVSVKLDTPLVKISVEPQVVSFQQREKKSYTVTFTASAGSATEGGERFESGRLEWSDGKHVVGSPISFYWNHFKSN